MITEFHTYADERRALGDRLMMEYAGSLPPGQVLAAIARADLIVTSLDGRYSSDRIGLCESIARRNLTDRIGQAVGARARLQRRERAALQAW